MIWTLRVLLAALGLAALGALSRVPLDTNRDEAALLRFSWRTRGEAEQHCRNRTQAELDALPAHMRTPQVCTGRIASYRLELELDEHKLPPQEVRAAGAHADRPIYVLREIPLTPGPHEFEAEFYNTLHPQAHRMKYEAHVVARPGDILLITYDDERDSLFLRREKDDDE